MDLKLSRDTEERLKRSIQRYLEENFGEGGELKASLLLKFVLAEIAPTVYNRAVADAQAYLQEKAADLENVCFADEFTFWKPVGKGSPRKPERR